MISRLLSLDDATAIAHRGGSKLRPENTMLAFAHAVAIGVDAIECDVHLSRDGEPVVIHDDTLDRTTDGTGPVASRTAADLSRVDAGARFVGDGGHPYRGRGGVPRLAEVLAAWPALPVIVEIKGDRADTAERALAVIREARAESRVIVGGFSHRVLAHVRAQPAPVLTSASRVEVQAALRRSWMWLGPRPSGCDLFQVPVRLKGRSVLSRRLVRLARRASVPVHAWIVDEAEEMRRLLAWGVTGLISDRPDRARQVVDEHRSRALHAI